MWTEKQIIRFVIIGIFALGVFGAKTVAAENEKDIALLKVLPTSKISLSEGIVQAAKGTATAISAKFELDDSGKLSLSIYIAEEGIAKDVEHNTFKEVSGDPTAEKWAPESEVVKDADDLKAAKDQLKILSGTKLSLLDFISMAQKDRQGIVFSAIPTIENHSPP